MKKSAPISCGLACFVALLAVVSVSCGKKAAAPAAAPSTADTTTPAPATPQPAPVEQIAITDPYELTLSVLAFIASSPSSSPDSRPTTPAPDETIAKSADPDSPQIDLAA